jgi:hypothetical protein
MPGDPQQFDSWIRTLSTSRRWALKRQHKPSQSSGFKALASQLRLPPLSLVQGIVQDRWVRCQRRLIRGCEGKKTASTPVCKKGFCQHAGVWYDQRCSGVSQRRDYIGVCPPARCWNGSPRSLDKHANLNRNAQVSAGTPERRECPLESMQRLIRCLNKRFL